MKIEHEIANVRVFRYDTLSNALVAVYGKNHFDLVTGLVQGSFLVENQPHLHVLQKSLKKPYDPEVDNSYVRYCALATLNREWKSGEFLRAIDKQGFYAASMSETAAYLRELKERHVKFGTIVHLGTFIVSDDDFQEKRIIVKPNGIVEVITMHGGTTTLKPSYEVVLSRKPLKETAPPPAKKRTFLGHNV